MESKLMPCTEECKHCQKYNDTFCVCWHPKIKGSKVQMKMGCVVQMLEQEGERR